MEIFLQILINSLVAGSIYSLVSVGFSLIYNTNRFVNFSHGAVVAFGGYIFYYLFNNMGVHPVWAIVLTLILTAFLGWLLNVIVYERLIARKTSASILLVASLALLIILESLIILLFGAEVKTIKPMNLDVIFNIWGASITLLQIILIITSFITLFVFMVFIKNARIGKAFRAVSDNATLANIVGIPTQKIYSLTFIISSMIAGGAGILIGMEQNLVPTMGTGLVIKGFAGAIIGGIGSIPGAILGSFLLGIVENFGMWYLPSGYKDAIAFFLLFIFLLILPRGILGIYKNQIND